MLTTYAVLCGAIVLFERDLIYPRPKSMGHVYRAKVLPVPGGTALLWMAPKPDVPAGGPVVVFFHGNGEQIANTEWLGGNFREMGIGFAAVEYPGYPGVAGEPAEASIMAASVAALEYLTGPMGIAREHIVLCGQSLGTGVAIQLAAAGWGRRLLLISPYTSLPGIAADALPFLPMQLLMTDEFDSAAWAPKVKQPVMIVHGTADRVVPLAHGEALRALFALPATMVSVPGGSHNDLWDRQYVHSRVVEFIIE